MSICPQCESKISYKQMMKHTWTNPIICENCKAKLHFHKKEWFVKSVPISLIIFCSVYTIFQMRTLWLSITLLIITLASIAKFLVDIGKFKLVLKKEK